MDTFGQFCWVHMETFRIFLTILSRILKSVICWESVVAHNGCFSSSDREGFLLRIRGQIRCLPLWKLSPLSCSLCMVLKDQLSYWRSELDFSQLLCQKNCQLSLNHGVTTGSKKAGKRNPACFSDARLIAEFWFWLLLTRGRGRRIQREQKHCISVN